MIKRLVWNFELCFDKAINFARFAGEEEDELVWEARYFWPDTAIITIKGLGENFLDLSQYKIKHRKDEYFLHSDGQSNIKKRKGSLWYKPLQTKRAHLSGFAKKIALSEEPKKSQLMTVDKIALVKRLDCSPQIKFELARLRVQEKTYFTACLESHAFAYVKELSEQMFPRQTTADYVHFLEQLIAPRSD